MRLAVGQEAGEDEAGQAALGLREHEEGVAHRRRAEPLVAGSSYSPSPMGSAPRDVRADVGAALLLGHRHAEQGAVLLGRGDAARGRRRRACICGSHSAAMAGLLAQGGDGGVGHRDRAAVAGLDLRPRHEHAPRGRRGRPARARARAARAGRGRSRGRSARARRGGTRPRRCGGRSGRSVRRIGRVLVGQAAELAHVLAAGQRAERDQAVLGPARALALQRLPQRRVASNALWSAIGGGWLRRRRC